MLRCKGIDSAGPERSFFTIVEGEAPATIKALGPVVRTANVLLAENRLAGRFTAAAPGLLALELSQAERTFFHNGIVFAALDAVNDPVRNPTLTMMAAREEGQET
ncbi:MAG TPA: hypothetical protein VH854_02385 [Thermoanaerobaculia bacterium]|jgi:hypothetical protein|nr:hypothetical protein [Thermoanaerobaculia bacterium]